MNNDYIVAADEDFSPTGLRGTTDDGGSFIAVDRQRDPRRSHAR